MEEAIKLLEEALKGEGAFNRDPIQHAENTIDNMKELITKALVELKAKK